MIRLSKLTDYAIVVLSQMAREPQARYASSQLASNTGVPETTVAKILKSVSAAGLINATRGAQGGYQLNIAGDKMTVRAIIEALEGPIAITDCVGGAQGCCNSEAKCPMRGNWDKVNDTIIHELDGVMLTDMMQTRTPQKLYGIKK